MSERKSDFKVTRRYIPDEGGWETVDTYLMHVTLETANEVATGWAWELDKQFGNSHFWTVDIYNLDGSSSYYQYFHGRIE